MTDYESNFTGPEYATPREARVASQEADADHRRESLSEDLQDKVDNLRDDKLKLNDRIGDLERRLAAMTKERDDLRRVLEEHAKGNVAFQLQVESAVSVFDQLTAMRTRVEQAEAKLALVGSAIDKAEALNESGTPEAAEAFSVATAQALLDQANAELSLLRSSNSHLESCANDLRQQLEAETQRRMAAELAHETDAGLLQAENCRLRKALKFYADTSKYPTPLTGGLGALYFDCGSVAQQALSPEPAPGSGETV